MPTQSTKELALELAGLGYYVFPTRDKRPTMQDSWPDAATIEPAQIHSMWSGANSDCLPGVACGKSGIVVVDVDIKGEDVSGYESAAALDIPMRPNVITPRGGMHIYFREGNEEVSNSISRVAKNIDIKAGRGYVVAYYSIGVAPAALPTVPAVIVESSRPAVETYVPPPVEGDIQDQGRYVSAVVRGIRDDYLNAPQGQGSDALFKSLCRGLETCNRYGVKRAIVLEALNTARLLRVAASGGTGGQSAAEMASALHSAERRVGSSPGVAPRERTEITFNGQPIPYEQREAQDEKEIEEFDAKFLTPQQLNNLPDPQWLVKHWMALDSMGSIVGASGARKTFVALDLACHVALGIPWHGHKVRQGLVLYVAAEGGSGIKRRIQAWEKEHGRSVLDLLVFPEPIQSRSDDWAKLVAFAAKKRPVLVILDTQARVSLGYEENSASEMGQFVNTLDILRRACDAHVTTVHHHGKAGRESGGRGSSAVYAALDSEITVEKIEDVVSVNSTKVKDSSDEMLLQFRSRVVTLGHDEDGDAITSLVMVPITQSEIDTREELVRAAQFAIVDAVQRYPVGELFTRAKLRPLVSAQGVDKATYELAWTRLINANRFTEVRTGLSVQYQWVAAKDMD